MARDANRRIVEIEENFLDEKAGDGYRTEQVEFTYGDGNLSSGDLDTGSEAEPTKLYWAFIDDFAGGAVLGSSDPNRLVREQRTHVDGTESVTYDKHYYYDPNGNRLVLVEKDDEGDLSAITRYNYVYSVVDDGSDEEDPPGTPASGLWMDYEGAGRDQLLSTQKFVFNESEEVVRVEVETFTYLETHPHVAARERKTYLWDEGESAWWVRLVEHATFEYAYDRLQKNIYWYEAYDDEEVVIDEGSIGEMHAYDDLLGRRVGVFRCESEDATTIPWGPEGCKAQTTHFDYYGLSQRVAAVRLSPFRYDYKEGYINVGDQFHESYSYGPTGAVVRTNELDDADGETGWDDYVLPDLFGGTTGLLAYAEETYDREVAAQHFDAFGVRVATTGAWGGAYEESRYRWRSQEGSETDDLDDLTLDINDAVLAPPVLIYMQTRPYDPALGRFLMADSIPLGAFSPQGLNRYAYCTNDPVNRTDETGLFIDAVIALVGLIGAAWGGVDSLANGFTGGGLWAAIFGTLAGLAGIARLGMAGAQIAGYSLALGGLGALLLGIIFLSLLALAFFLLYDILDDTKCITIKDPNRIFIQKDEVKFNVKERKEMKAVYCMARRFESNYA